MRTMTYKRLYDCKWAILVWIIGAIILDVYINYNLQYDAGLRIELFYWMFGANLLIGLILDYGIVDDSNIDKKYITN